MKAIDLILLIQEKCKSNDEIYITDIGLQYNPDISLDQKDPSEEDESGGWRDIDGAPIKGKPFHIW